MPREKRRKPRTRKLQNKRKLFVTVALMIGLLAAGGALAARAGLFRVAQKSRPQAKEIAPAAFTPSTPAKEYIYVGGRLLAIEEP